MLITGRLVTAIGYLWLLWAILSGTGLLGDLPNMAGSAFYSLALIFLGRALRKRGMSSAEAEYQFEAPTPPATNPRDVPADTGPPPPPRPLPPPPRKAQPAPGPPVEEAPPSPLDPDPVERSIPVDISHKSSRELIEEARARWGKKP